MPHLTSFDGTNVFYKYHKGSHPLTLVFLHGVGSNQTVWKKELRYFQSHGYSTLTLDLRGHGKSDAPEEFERYGLPDFAKDVYTILKQENIKNFCLIGHSLGGAIAINYCMNHKRNYPSSMILIESASTYPFTHDRLLNKSPYVTHVLRFIAKHKLTREKHVHHFKDCDLSTDGLDYDLHMASHLMHLTPLQSLVRTLDNVEKYVFKNQKRIDHTLKHLRIPTLLIAGELDRVVPVKFSKRIQKLDKKAKLNIIKNAHHEVIIKHAREVNKVMNNFISQL
tara:strand:+ start:3387 stop:4226 length:840 start_codon:yes stop_codon:yes gene_type:complete